MDTTKRLSEKPIIDLSTRDGATFLGLYHGDGSRPPIVITQKLCLGLRLCLFGTGKEELAKVDALRRAIVSAQIGGGRFERRVHVNDADETIVTLIVKGKPNSDEPRSLRYTSSTGGGLSALLSAVSILEGT